MLDGDPAVAAMEGLDAVVNMVHRGNSQAARELCAAIVLKAQPLIAARSDLWQAAVYALLIARAFRLLSRLVMAVTGRPIEIVLLPAHGATLTKPSRNDQRERTIYSVDPRWLEQLTPGDAAFVEWCNFLVDWTYDHREGAGARSRHLRLEPI